MLIVMDSAASAEDVRRVVETVEGLGLQAHAIPGAQRTAIGITGNRGSIDINPRSGGTIGNRPLPQFARALQAQSIGFMNYKALLVRLVAFDRLAKSATTPVA